MPGVDAQTLAELVDRHGAALKLYARQWTTTPDDVVQQALIELCGLAETPNQPVAWLFTVVRRRAISLARAERTRQRIEAAAASAWFERLEEQKAAAVTVAELLAELPLADREIVIARVYGGLTFEEIGKLVGLSSSSAQRRHEAAIDRLRNRSQTSCPNDPT